MPHLHLNLYNMHGDAVDDEGSDYADLEEARSTAVRSIRAMLSDEVMRGELNLVGHLDIVDDGGVVLSTITFTEALCVISPSEACRPADRP